MDVVIIEMKIYRSTNLSFGFRSQHQPIAIHSRRSQWKWGGWAFFVKTKKINLRDGSRKTKRREHNISSCEKRENDQRNFIPLSTPQMFHLFLAFRIFGKEKRVFHWICCLSIIFFLPFSRAASATTMEMVYLWLSRVVPFANKPRTRVENLLQQFFELSLFMVSYFSSPPFWVRGEINPSQFHLCACSFNHFDKTNRGFKCEYGIFCVHNFSGLKCLNITKV